MPAVRAGWGMWGVALRLGWSGVESSVMGRRRERKDEVDGRDVEVEKSYKVSEGDCCGVDGSVKLDGFPFWHGGSRKGRRSAGMTGH